MKNLLRIESLINKYNADHFNINLDYFDDYITKINYNLIIDYFLFAMSSKFLRLQFKFLIKIPPLFLLAIHSIIPT